MFSRWVTEQRETRSRYERAKVPRDRPVAIPTRLSGFISKWSLLLFLSSAAYFAWVLLSPQIEVYRAKSLIRNACVHAMREEVAAGTHPQWEDELIERLEQLKLETDSVQYRVEASDTCVEEDCSCEGSAAFKISTPWPVVTQVVPSIPPRLSTHRVSVQVTYR